METCMDLVSCTVSPYLIYFGQLGITPKVLAVEGEEVLTVEKVEGLRLGEHIYHRNLPRDTLRGIYDLLGQEAGIVSRYGIGHGHLHSFNVVVAPRFRPVIIDWGKAYVGLPADLDTCLTANGEELMESLDRHKDKLAGEGEILKGRFRQGFKASWERADLPSAHDIHTAARGILYGQ